MSMKSGVRIVKRAEGELRQEDVSGEEQLMIAAQSEVKNLRDPVATITEWITELRQKKDAERAAAHAFKSLFTEAA